MDFNLFLLLTILLPILFLIGLWIYFLLYLIVVHRLYKLNYKHDYVKHARHILHTLLKLTLNIRYRVVNKQIIPDDNFVLISNHQSLIDPIILLSECNDQYLAGIAKKEVHNIPLIKPWLDHIRILSLDRDNDREGAKTIIQAIKQAKEGQPMFIFPEGTRSRTGVLLPFRDGAFKLALKSEQDIYISVFHNFHKHKWFHLVREHLLLEFIGPIKFEDYKHMTTQELSEMIRTLMEERLGEDNENRRSY